jgi:hypothetical protein
VEDAFQQADAACSIEEMVQEEIVRIFHEADRIHKENMNTAGWDSNCNLEGREDPLGEDGTTDNDTDTSFDPTVLEEAIQTLYAGAKATKLAVTILLVNLYTVHGVSNCFVDELFAILQGYLLPPDNCLPRNYYGARSLTQKLGLSYNSIHVCVKGCMLFRGEHIDAVCCPNCGAPRYKDERWQKFLVKRLRHFPIIPRLQRMFRSPAISKLMH